jgi:hypothetical protein
MVSLDIYNIKAADQFVKEALGKILMQRMISPPNTDMLCITIIGNIKAEEFKNLWKKHLQSEIPMMMFMEQIKATDVIHGSQNGEVIEQVSLIK